MTQGYRSKRNHPGRRACVFAILALAVATLFGPPGPLARSDERKIPDPAEIDRLLKAKELEVREREAEVEKVRLHVLERAMEFDQARKKAAADERESLEQKTVMLQYRIEGKKWALQQFETAESGLVPVSKSAPKIQQRWKRLHEMNRGKFVNFPQQSRQQVKTGEALNFFLDACGPTVLAHQLQLEQFKLEQENMAAQEALARRDKLLDRDPVARDVRAAVLEEIHGTQSLDVDQLQRLTFVKGLIGNKLPVRLGTMSDETALPLDWPLLLLKPQFDAHRKLVESAKRQAIQELSIPSQGGITAETRANLMKGLDNLQSAFSAKYAAYIKLLRAGGGAAADGAAWIATRNYLNDLRHGTTLFLEARSADDVSAGTFPPPGRAKVSVDELLAYMSRNGLRFGAARSTSAETSQQFVYQLLVGFYMDLYSLRLAIEEDEQQEEYSQQRIAELTQIQYDKFTDPTAPPQVNWRAGVAPVIGMVGEILGAGGGGTGTGGGPPGDYAVGSKVKNPSPLLLWSGTIVMASPPNYRIRIDYSSGDYGTKGYTKGHTYDFVQGDFKPADGISIDSLLDKLR